MKYILVFVEAMSKGAGTGGQWGDGVAFPQLRSHGDGAPQMCQPEQKNSYFLYVRFVFIDEKVKG